MNRFLSSFLTLALVGALGGGAVSAKQCHDAKGRFIKCPSPHMMSAPAMKKKCRDAKGKFMKCHDSMMMHKKM